MQLRFFWFIFILFIFLRTHAQDCVAINFNTDHGLSSNEVYDIYQDEFGKIWITTDKGLVKFDGQNFKAYGVSDGLNSSVFFNLFIQSNTQIWVGNIKNELYSFDPTADLIRFTAFKYNHVLDSLLRVNLNKKYIRKVWIDSLSNMHFSFLLESGDMIIDKRGQGQINQQSTELVNTIISEYTTNLELRFDFSSKNKYAYLTTGSKNKNQKRLKLINESTGETHALSYFESDYTNRSFGLADFYHSPDIDLFILDNLLIIIADSNVIEVQTQAIGYSLLYHQNFIFVGTSAGIEVYDRKGVFQANYFEDLHITSLLLDLSGKVWMTTLNNGLFLVANFEIKDIHADNKRMGKIQTIHVDELHIYAFSSKRKFYVLNRQGKIIDEYTGVQEYNGTIHSDDNLNFDRFFGSHIANGEIYNSDNRSYKLSNKGDSTFLRVGTNTLFKYKNDQLEFLVLDELPRINKACEMTGDEILLATNKGLYKLTDFEHIERIHASTPILDKRLLNVIKIGENALITTENSGLILLQKNKLTSINTSNGLISNKINALEVQSNSSFWVGTSSGLSRIELNKSEKEALHIESFNIENGLPSNEIYDIDFFKDSLWLSTKEGISYFPWQNLTKNTDLITYPLLVDSIKINNHYYNGRTTDVTINESDILEIYVSQISYGLMGSVHYEYKIEGYLSDWIQSDNGHFLVSGLEHGSYVLDYRSIKRGQNKSEIKSLIINVPPPWYKLTLVRLLGALILLLILIFIYKFTIYRIKVKNNLEVEKVNLELKILVGQMNPHFMFNTIHSIQSFIILNDKKEALDYLSDFALLIRKTLDFSRKEVISWDEEKDFLKLYVSLESERFEQDILISFEEELTSSIQAIGLPPLLLQPLIENAIIHGIQGSSGKGKIRISIQETAESYIFNICNNGRPMNPSHQHKEHQSHGLDILKQRIALYNRTNKAALSITKSTRNETVVSFEIRKIVLHVS